MRPLTHCICFRLPEAFRVCGKGEPLTDPSMRVPFTSTVYSSTDPLASHLIPNLNFREVSVTVDSYTLFFLPFRPLTSGGIRYFWPSTMDSEELNTPAFPQSQGTEPILCSGTLPFLGWFCNRSIHASILPTTHLHIASAARPQVGTSKQKDGGGLWGFKSLRGYLDDEASVAGSGVPYTIVRAGKLTDQPGGQTGISFGQVCHQLTLVFVARVFDIRRSLIF